MKKIKKINLFLIFIVLIILTLTNFYGYSVFKKYKKDDVVITFVLQDFLAELAFHPNTSSKAFIDDQDKYFFDNKLFAAFNYRHYLIEKFKFKNFSKTEYFVEIDFKDHLEKSSYNIFDSIKKEFCKQYINNSRKEFMSFIKDLEDGNKLLINKNLDYNLNVYSKILNYLDINSDLSCNLRITNIKKTDIKFNLQSYMISVFFLNLILIFLFFILLKFRK
tara:strand:- start:751 stop:1410 length:660 start_codon:yes stop_codon:yes gene_type:complete